MSDLDISKLANSLAAELRALPEWRTPLVRPVIKKSARRCADLSPAQMLELTHLLIDSYDLRGVAYELLSYHRAAMHSLDAEALEALGQGIDSWWAVDTFARLLSGPAWVNGLVNDDVILRWAASPDLWWRRAALVSTVAYNVRSQGGQGDTRRTLLICRRLACDREDMVVKALSWSGATAPLWKPSCLNSITAWQGESSAKWAASLPPDLKRRKRINNVSSR